MKLKENVIEGGKINLKDYISPSYVNNINPKYIEIDRVILWRNYACWL